jgi:hypothetical protein
MEIFHNSEGGGAHERFQKWLDENPGGFFVNCRAADDLMLHKSSCDHLIFNEPVSLTAHRKVCSLDRRKLEEWAAEQSNKPLQFCRSCSPRT